MSHNWYSLPLGDGMTEGETSDEIRQVFEQVFAETGKPRDMAVFKYFNSEGRLQCQVTAYFSPAAERVAHVFNARPCTRPPRAGLDLLAGEPGAWAVLFPAT
jgi:hypothetical protein